MNSSLRRRLVTLLLTTMFLGWSATALLTWRDVMHEIGEMLDAHLARSAHLIAAQFLRQFDSAAGQTVPGSTHHDFEIAFQILDPRGGLRLRSASAPPAPMSEAKSGYSDVVIGNDRWRIYSLIDPSSGHVVQVGEHAEIREEFGQIAAGHILHPLYLALPALALLIWLAVSWGLRPLARIAGEIATRQPGNLAALDEAPAPREVRPLIAALNGLFLRVGASLERERRFTADATHELRTPLAAIKIQAQVAQGARDMHEREAALGKVIDGTDRMTHLVEQLLMLARLDPDTALAQPQRVDLHALAVQCLSDHLSIALAKQIEVALCGAATAPVAGDPTLLAVLLRNLVDNAIRYVQPGGEVEIVLACDDSSVTLQVNDNGPGITAAERDKVFARFYRILGSGESGSGLGLSIVQRIADLHRAVIRLDDAVGGHGLSVSIKFALAAS